MTKQELIDHLSILANSGTAKFVEQISKNEGASAEFIGQFGFGFYSSYMIADKITVRSKKGCVQNAKQYIWESMADQKYVIAEDKKGDDLKWGTEITLFLKPQTYLYDSWIYCKARVLTPGSLS